MGKKSKTEVPALLRALEYLALVFNAKSEQSMYANIEYNYGRTYNLVVGLGSPIELDLIACPQTDILLEALYRAGPSYSITQLSPDKLKVLANDFHVFVPCANPAGYSWPEPDPLMAPLGNEFMKALDLAAPFCDDKSERLLCAAIQLRDTSILATSGSVVIEAWHGFSMPDGIFIPKLTAKILHKAKRELKGFGFSDNTITFYFTDGCWLRSQIYLEKLPDIKRHIENADSSALRIIPHDFFEAIEKVRPFSTSGNIWVESNLVSSHPFDVKDEGSGLSLEFSGQGHAYRVYRADDLHAIRKFATKWTEYGRDDGTLFFGEKVRGMIWHEKKKNEHGQVVDDDIPF